MFLVPIISVNCAVDEEETNNCGVNTENNFNNLKRTAAETVVSEKQSKIFRGENIPIIADVAGMSVSEDAAENPSFELDQSTSSALFTGAAVFEAHSDSSRFEAGENSKTSHMHDTPPGEKQILNLRDSDSSQTSQSPLQGVRINLFLF